MYPRIWWAGFYPPRADMVMAIQSIKAEGLKTAALTNNWKHANGRALPAELDPVMKLFDVVVESAKVGMRKPDPEIYQLVLEKLRVKAPEEAIFLDDIGQNLKAARARGIRTIKVGEGAPGAALDELQAELGFSLREFVPGTVSVRPALRIDTAALERHLASSGVPGLDAPVTRLRQFGPCACLTAPRRASPRRLARPTHPGWHGRRAVRRARTVEPFPPPRTKWTRRVPHPVLIGHAAQGTDSRTQPTT
jgi:HAD superfamily hydrolase (TIGR01509 family)